MRKYIILIVILLSLSACESELKISSPSSLTYNGFWDDESGAKAAHVGLYGALRGQANMLWNLGEIRSDVWGGKTFENFFSRDLVRNNITISTAPFTPWGSFYGRIHQVNDFLENIPEVEFQNESERDHFMGEAYGIRAFYYYTMLKTWGPVVISEQTFVSEGDFDPSNVEGLSRARSSKEEVMAFIKSDIEKSLAAFGNDNSFYGGNKNYWSKAATLALKGDVYIWSGNLLGGGGGDFRAAKDALMEVGDSGVDLADNYEDLWGASNENNKEFIFAIQYAEDEATNFFNSFTGRATEIYPAYNEEGENMGDLGFVISGGNNYGPTVKVLELLDDNKDSRKKAIFIRLFKDSNDGNGYDHYDEDKYYGAITKKFLGRVDGAQRIFDSDFPIYRYADVLLMLAEAKNHLGENPSDEINQIRKRAYGDNFESSMLYSNQSEQANAEAILEERFKEFLVEGKRWWDLRRAGDKFVTDNIPYIEPGNEYQLQLPISLDMIGSNPELEQTPGWK